MFRFSFVRFITLVQMTLIGVLLFFPTVSEAAGCKCSGLVETCGGQACSTKIEVKECVKTYKNKQVTTQDECGLIIDDRWPGNGTSIGCQYTVDDKACGFYAKSELVCPNKLGEDPCPTYGGFCEQGFCQLPPDGLARYNSLPSFLGLQADLQIKKPLLSIKIPGLTFSESPSTGKGADGKTYLQLPYIAEYLAALYKYGLAVITIVAVAMVIKKGFDIVLSRGGEMQSAAYERIGQICIGLVIMWGSYTVLRIINPALVDFKVLSVQYIEAEPLSQREESPVSGAAEEVRPPTAPVPRGKGAKDIADATQCPDLAPGTKFTGAFTTYYNYPKKQYGIAGEYKGIYKGSDPSLQGMGDFFCAIAMECGCPSGYNTKNEGKMCANSKINWAACKYFDSNADFCPTHSGKWQFIAGKTVAASSCFAKGCEIKVGDKVLTVTDRGAGIIGTHFDLYLGVRGEPDFLTDTSWLSPQVEIVNCSGKATGKELQRLQKSYENYKPGVCKPGYNC